VSFRHTVLSGDLSAGFANVYHKGEAMDNLGYKVKIVDGLPIPDVD
jgi:hypothetical protein